MSEADRELTEHLAEKVMGWKPSKPIHSIVIKKGYFSIGQDCAWVAWPKGNGIKRWNPLEDANAALEVLEMSALKRGAVLSFLPWRKAKWEVSADIGATNNDSFCRAICLAAAKATGYEKETGCTPEPTE